MHQDQVPTSPDLVRRLLAAQYPSLAGEPIAAEPLHGTDTDVYRVGAVHCVRLPIIGWSFKLEDRIAEWTPWLARRLSTRVAVPLYRGHPQFGYPADWTVYPWVEGETLSPGCDDLCLVAEIAAFLTELRALPVPSGAPKGGLSPHDMDADVRDRIAQLDDFPADLPGAWDRLLTAPAWDGSKPVWLHGDVAPGNLVVRGSSLIAAIDWGGLGVGDPANDLQVAWNLFTPRARAAFSQRLDVDDATWDRARARAFAQACFQLSYYRDSLPPLAAVARGTFDAVLGELS